MCWARDAIRPIWSALAQSREAKADGPQWALYDAATPPASQSEWIDIRVGDDSPVVTIKATDIKSTPNGFALYWRPSIFKGGNRQERR